MRNVYIYIWQYNNGYVCGMYNVYIYSNIIKDMCAECGADLRNEDTREPMAASVSIY